VCLLNCGQLGFSICVFLVIASSAVSGIGAVNCVEKLYSQNNMLFNESNIKLCSFISHSGALYVYQYSIPWRVIRAVSYVLHCVRSTSFRWCRKTRLKRSRIGDVTKLGVTRCGKVKVKVNVNLYSASS